MSKKITDLETVSALNDTDKFLVETENGSKAVPFNVIVEKSKPTLVSNLTTTTTGYALDATQGNALNDKIGKVLWENTNPVGVDTMDITLSSDDYDVLDIYYSLHLENIYMLSVTILKNYTALLQHTYYSSAVTQIINISRVMNCDSPTKYTLSSLAVSSDSYNDNTRLIPLKIIGRKLS